MSDATDLAYEIARYCDTIDNPAFPEFDRYFARIRLDSLCADPATSIIMAHALINSPLPAGREREQNSTLQNPETRFAKPLPDRT